MRWRVLFSGLGMLWLCHSLSGQSIPLPISQAIDTARTATDSLSVAHAWLNEGYAHYDSGHFTQALHQFQQAAAWSRGIHVTTWTVATQQSGLMLDEMGLLDSAVLALGQALEIAEHTADPKRIYLYASLGDWAMHQAEPEQALDYWQRGQGVAEATRDTAWIINFEAKRARQYRSQGQTTTALHMYLECLELSHVLHDLVFTANTHNKIGVLYYQLGQPHKAIAHYRQSGRIFRQLDKPRGVVQAHNNIGLAFLQENNLDSALLYFNQAKAGAEATNYLNGMGWSHYGLAQIALKQNEAREAIALIWQSLSYRKNQKQYMAQNYLVLGHAYRQLARTDSALHYYTEAETLARQVQDASMLRDALEGLSWAYEVLGQPYQALAYYRQYNAMADSLLNEDNTRQLTLIGAEYAFQQERDSIAKARNQEQLAYRLQVKQQRLQKAFISIVLLMSLVLVWIVGRGYRQKKLDYERVSRLNEEVQKQRDHLDEMLVARDRFFSIISHDLRGPVNSFGSLSTLLLDYYQKGKVKDLGPLLEALEQNSINTRQLLDNLLKWAMQQQGTLVHRPMPLYLNAMVQDIVSLLSFQAQDKEIDLQAHIAPDIQVYADHNVMMTILRNLVSNALKFTLRQGTVSVTASTKAGKVCIQIQDTGIGMDEEQLSKVFGIGHKTVRRGTAGEKGTGLGLPLVKDFVEASGGTIAVQSEVGKGTLFTLTFPKVAPEEAEAQPVELAEPEFQ